MGELNNPLYRIFLTREIYSLHEKKFFLSRGKNIYVVGINNGMGEKSIRLFYILMLRWAVKQRIPFRGDSYRL